MRPKLKKRHHEEPIEQASNDVEIAHFEAHLKIDKHDLDTDVAEQPRNFQQVCERLAHAKSIRDQIKDDLKTVESECFLDVRESKGDKGKSMTEKDALAHVQLKTARRSAFKRLIEADREVNRWEGMKEAWKDRGFMLRSMVELHISAYFQTDSISAASVMEKDYRSHKNKERLHEMRKGYKRR